MSVYQVVIDTNVLIAALRSRRGASFRILSMVDIGKFEINLSIPLILEYEATATRMLESLSLSKRDLSVVLDYFCEIARRHEIHYLWRPILSDPKDDMILELAVAAQCDFIVTFNRRDFIGVERFGLKAITPQEFLVKTGGKI